MIIILAITLAVLMGIWMSVINIDKLPVNQLQIVADSLTTLMSNFALTYFVCFLLIVCLGVVLQKNRRLVLGQTITFCFWFVPLVHILNTLSELYSESLLAPALNIPFYLALLGLAWVSWQTAKFMSACEAAVALKMKR